MSGSSRGAAGTGLFSFSFGFIFSLYHCQPASFPDAGKIKQQSNSGSNALFIFIPFITFSFIRFLQVSQGRKTKIQNKQEHTGVKNNKTGSKHLTCSGFFYRIPRPDNYRGNDNRCNQKPDKKINKTVRREYDFHHFPRLFSIPYCPACFSWSAICSFTFCVRTPLSGIFWLFIRSS